MIGNPRSLAHRQCHELRKPLAAIQAYAELLLDGFGGPAGDESLSFARAILRNVSRLDHEILRWTELSSLLDETHRPASQPVDLGELLDRITEVEDPEESALLPVRRDDAENWPLRVECDPRWLRRVLEDLMLLLAEVACEGGCVHVQARELPASTAIDLRLRAGTGEASSRTLPDIPEESLLVARRAGLEVRVLGEGTTQDAYCVLMPRAD
jgi:signal transduction histidine kinase